MKSRLFIILFFSSILVIPITGFSFWIDESSTAFFASQSNLNDLNDRLFSTRMSEIQMPGYIYYMWTWEKLFGHREFMLRLSNLPFIIALLILLAIGPFSFRMKVLLGLIISFSPFIWFNINEARSTIPMFVCGGAAMFSLSYYFSRIGTFQVKGVWIFAASLIIGVGLNMLFLLFLPSAAVLFFLLAARSKIKFKVLFKDWWLALLVAALVIGGLCIYYIWTLSAGAGGQKETPKFLNTLFMLYEYFGFSGLGPPRNILRETRAVSIIKPFIPLMIICLLAYILFFASIIKGIKRRSEIIQIFNDPYLITFVSGVLVFSLICSVAQFRFWGRHAAFLLPFMFFYLAQKIDDILDVDAFKLKQLIVFIPLIILMLISDINIRFKSIYKKENNKEAALQAMELIGNNGVILWTGLSQLAVYYGLNVRNVTDEMPKSWTVTKEAVIPPYNRDLPEFLNKFRNENIVLVLFSRRESDFNGYYKKYIHDNELTLITSNQDYSIYSMK